MTLVAHSPEEYLLAFTRALRAAGVPVTHDRATSFLTATSLVGLGDASATYIAGRATLCAAPDDLDRYDQVFEAWFGTREGLPRVVPREEPRTTTAPLQADDDPAGTGSEHEEEADVVAATASDAEVLRHRDVASLDGDQKALLDAMIRAIRPRPPLRRANRRHPWRRGEIDLHRTLRSSLRQMGEPAQVAHRKRSIQPRRVVLLVDVSGSMSGYADALLRLAHRLTETLRQQGGVVETFTIGTRLTRITRALRLRDPERALVAAGETVPDWSGGTRLGETLHFFLDRWGQRGMARGSVVVVFSDGWERGTPTELSEQMARLSRLAHQVIWVNPHRGKDGYLPVQQGVVAVLPHVDHFVAGHSLATYQRLVELIARC